jgi:predicted amidohydrolase
MQDLRVSLLQTHQFWEDKQRNFQHFENILSGLEPTDILIFPEMFHTGFTMNAAEMAEPMDGEGIQWLTAQAQKWKTAVVASLIIKEDDHYFNRMVFIEPTGQIHTYDKRKLFTLAKEDEHYIKGSENTIVRYKGWNILLQVCYDLRFPEQCRNTLSSSGEPTYDLLIYVANWPNRRSLHWKTLLQARAIENQCYVIGVNRVGTDANGLEYSGDSSVINALGTIEGQLADDEGIVRVVLRHEELNETRTKLNFLKDQ